MNLEPLYHLLDRFVPDHRRSEPIRRWQSRLLVGMLWIGGTGTAVNAGLELRESNLPLASALFGSSALIWALLWSYRRYGLHGVTVQVFLSLCWAAFFVGSALTGGIRSGAANYFGILPAISIALLHARAAMFWTGVGALSLFALSLGTGFDIFPALVVEKHLRIVPMSLNNMALLAYLAGLFLFLEAVNRNQRKAVEEAKARADDASAAKSAFLANMSHELRTPMNGVLGITEMLLLDPTVSTVHRQRLQVVHDSGMALVDLLNDILDLSKVEAGKVVLERVAFRPRRLAASVASLFEQAAERKGLILSVEITANLPERLIGDPARLRQVLSNLVGNAIKFSQVGRVTLRLWKDGDHLCGAVIDEGPGLSLEAQGRLFQAFSQADGSTARRHGGTGLGLAICKRLIELMEGQIGVESQPGAGARFWFRIPTTIAGEQEPSTEPQAPLPLPQPIPTRPRVLVIEDQPVNQLVARGMLESMGCEVVTEEDGQRGLQAILEDGPWSTIYVDLHLPGIDGREVVRRARQAGVRTRIVGISADIDEKNPQAEPWEGLDGRVAKPLRLEALRQSLGTTQEPNP